MYMCVHDENNDFRVLGLLMKQIIRFLSCCNKTLMIVKNCESDRRKIDTEDCKYRENNNLNAFDDMT